MIALAEHFLLVQLANGEQVPYSAEAISLEVLTPQARHFDPEFVQQASQAVFHYFKQDLCRQWVTFSEYSAALDKVLSGFKPGPPPLAKPEPAAPHGVLDSDLCRLAQESGEGGELFFFPRLRDELRHQLQQAPRVLRFHGLRSCVKQLAHSERWTLRCRNLEAQIVAFVHHCLGTERCPEDLALVIE